MSEGPFDHGGWTIRQANSSGYLKVAYGWLSDDEERWWLYNPDGSGDLDFTFPGYAQTGFISRYQRLGAWQFGEWTRRCSSSHPANADHSDGHPDDDDGIPHATQARLYGKGARKTYSGASLPLLASQIYPQAYPSPAGCPNEELAGTSAGGAEEAPRHGGGVRQVDPGFLRIRLADTTTDIGYLFCVDDGGQDNVIQRIEYWMMFDDDGGLAELDVVNLPSDDPNTWGHEFNQDIYDAFLAQAGKNPSVTVVSLRYYPCAVTL